MTEPAALIKGVGTLFGFQLAGEVLVRLLQVPIPGPIVGLLLLFAFLRARLALDFRDANAIETTAVAQVTDPMLRNLAILFVPSGVGVLQYANLFLHHGPAVVIVLVTSTLATLCVTALVFAAAQPLARRLRRLGIVRRLRFTLAGRRRPFSLRIASLKASRQPS
jgi:holin-like protein